MPEKLPPLLPFPAECDNLPEALKLASQHHGLSRLMVLDATGAKLTYRKLWLRSHLLGKALHSEMPAQGSVAILLPTSAAGTLTFLALHLQSRLPVLLNFSAGTAANLSALSTSCASCVITSRIFVAKAKLEGLIDALGAAVPIIYLEDMKQKINPLAAACALIRLLFGVPARWIPAIPRQQPAVVLFTSGSEGNPKGVALSHENILSNIAQVQSMFEFSESDTMFSALPQFHSFGLTVGTLVPLLLGFPVYFYPSPLQYKLIPPLCKSTGATILIAADTFLRGYGAHATKDDFSTLRLLVAGAERLKPQTYQLYKEKFGLTILQGYGVTETSPVASANTPSQHKEGSVGRLLPGMQWHIQPVDGIAEGGELWLKGPNVMLGYMLPSNPGAIQDSGEWYNTGDIVSMDADGFLTITGRLKRFAKLGGEMVSLTLVEEIASEASPNHAHAAIAIADERKGEQIILLTEDEKLTREALHHAGKQRQVAELFIPKKLLHVDSLPRLGNGKVNYVEAKILAEKNAA